MSVHRGGRGPGHICRSAGKPGTGATAPSLKFNVAANSQYVPLLAL